VMGVQGDMMPEVSLGFVTVFLNEYSRTAAIFVGSHPRTHFEIKY